MTSREHALKAVRGSFIDITRTVDNPEETASALRLVEDGLLLVKQGEAEWFSEWEDGKHQIPGTTRVRDYCGKLTVSGFIDTHIHYLRSEMVGAYGERLLERSSKHIFPTERRYEGLEYVREMSAFFIKQLLRNGTTTVLVFGTVHPQSVNALLEATSHINMRMIVDKTMMDRNVPDCLLDTIESNYHQSKELIEHWYKNGHLSHVIMPRFTPTSSPEQIAMAQRLKEEYPDIWVHTHLCENKDETAWVKSFYPDHNGCLDVYHQYSLTSKNRVFVHCIHLEEKGRDRSSETKSSIAFCPTSNLYLDSGLSNLKEAWQKKVKVGMGTDIGVGITLNMLQTLNEAYKVLQLQGYRPSAYEALCLATLGGTKSLGLDDLIGSFLPGKKTDFVVMEPIATPLQQLCYDNSVSLVDKSSVMMALSDDRLIYRAYADGYLMYECS